jgi:hypothetical protein
VSGSFDGGGQPSLVPGAISGYAPGHDLPSIGGKPSQQFLVLIIDPIHPALAKTTGLPLASFKPDHHNPCSFVSNSLIIEKEELIAQKISSMRWKHLPPYPPWPFPPPAG